MKRICIIITVSMLCAAAPAFSLGGGGIFWGESTIVPEHIYDGDLTNTETVFTYNGGYGYRVSDYGQRSGGFGMIIRSSDASPEELFGVFGGGMTGAQMRMGPLTASTNLYLGVGGFGGSLLKQDGGLSVMGELNGELGLRVVSWMQVSLYAGIQGITRLGSPQSIAESSIYAPVIGTRITWGSF